MEDGERIDKSSPDYKIPLSIFDAMRLWKLQGEKKAEEEKKNVVSTTRKEDVSLTEYFFPPDIF